jgi:uncharacterized protein (DUF1501 family)
MRRKIERREFLRRSAVTAIGLGFSGPLMERLALGRGTAAAASDKVVVAVNLFGGNDFLNTVVPVGQYDRYRELRPGLGLPRELTLPLPGTDQVALNHGMTALHGLYAAGKVAVVVGVGAPPDTDGLFDHEASQNIFQSGNVSGRAATVIPSGWLGRYLDTVGAGTIAPGVDLGGGSLLLDGATREALAITSIGDLDIRISEDYDARLSAYRSMMEVSSPDSEVAEFSRLVRKEALDQAATVRERTENYEAAVEYPDNNPLANSLRQSAALVAADVGVRALGVGYDGFDTHANQNDGASPGNLGYHDFLLESVSEAVAAFHADLSAHGLGERVVTVVFSEFGRRPEENADVGTDHGYGSCMFVVGDTVQGGVYGEYPNLAPEALVMDGNVDATVDYRSVYATILARHCGADPAAVFGTSLPLLGFL